MRAHERRAFQTVAEGRRQVGAGLADLHSHRHGRGRRHHPGGGREQPEPGPFRRMGGHPPCVRRPVQHRPHRRRPADLRLQLHQRGQHALPRHPADPHRPVGGSRLQDRPVQHRRPRPVPDGHRRHPDAGAGHPHRSGARPAGVGHRLFGRHAGGRFVGLHPRPRQGFPQHQRGAGLHHDQLDRRQPGHLDVRRQRLPQPGGEHQERLHLQDQLQRRADRETRPGQAVPGFSGERRHHRGHRYRHPGLHPDEQNHPGL